MNCLVPVPYIIITSTVDFIDKTGCASLTAVNIVLYCNLSLTLGAVEDWQSFEWRAYEFVAWYVYLIFYNSMLINFDLIIYIDRCEQIVCVYPFYSVSFSGVSEDSDGIYASQILKRFLF